MAKIMATFTHDFATRWDLEAHIKKDRDDFMKIKDQMIEFGMIDAEHVVLFSQKDKHRHMGVLRFKDVAAYKKRMELMNGADWDKEITRVNRYESYVIDVELDI